MGISVDGAYCHKAFRDQLNLTMPLLADFHPKGEVAKAYGVWSEDYGVAGRALVMVGPDGKVAVDIHVASARGPGGKPDL